MKITWFLLLVLSCSSFPVKAQDDAKLERIHWEKELSKPTTLVFKNNYGNIRLRSTDDQKLVFHAVAQDSEQHRIQLAFDEQSDQIYAEVIFNNSEHLPKDHRLDAVIIVPSLLQLDIQIEGGDLSSKGLKSPVKATSSNSNITIKSSQSVDLFSQNGDINFYAKSGKKATKHQLKSHKGDINVYYLTQSSNAFKTVAGTEPSSNDAELLQSQVQTGRMTVFGDVEASNQFNLQTDTGFIRLINQKNQ